MHNRLLLLFLGLLVSACNSYTNKERYELIVGESVDIYYTTNSCCYYCLFNKEKLKHLTFVEKKTVDAGKKDCEGCNFTGAFTFKATSAGVDTIVLNHLTATMECSDNDGRTEKYVVEVK